jgi:hypothetical protein
MVPSEAGVGRQPLTEEARLQVFDRFRKRLVEWAKRFRGCSMDAEDREAEALCVLWEFSAQYDPSRDDTFFALCTKPLGERLLNAPRSNEMCESARLRRYVRQAHALLTPEDLALPSTELRSAIVSKLHCDKDSAFAVQNVLNSNSIMAELDDARQSSGGRTETDRLVENRFALLCFEEAQKRLCRQKGKRDCPQCNEAIRCNCSFFCLLYTIGAEGWWCDGNRETGEGMGVSRKDENEAARQLGSDPAAFRAMVAKARRVLEEVRDELDLVRE